MDSEYVSPVGRIGVHVFVTSHVKIGKLREHNSSDSKFYKDIPRVSEDVKYIYRYRCFKGRLQGFPSR